jgi:hypothetical protein
VKPSDIEVKLSRLQSEIIVCPDRERLRLEDSYWAEVSRLRSLGHYDRLPEYVSWLADYTGAKYLRPEDLGGG